MYIRICMKGSWQLAVGLQVVADCHSGSQSVSQ